MKPLPVFDVLVIGAGIVGAAVARECARAGLRVGIVESGVPGGGISGAGMGHVVVMDDTPAQRALTAYSRSLWIEESESLPDSVEYESRGTLWIAADEEEMAEVLAKHQTYAAAGIASEILEGAALTYMEPNLRQGLPGGLLVHEDAVIYPPAAVMFYLDQAQRLGAVLFHSTAISAGRGEVRLTDASLLKAKAIVLATGAECSLLPALPLQKRKGHLVITDRYPGFARHQLVELGYLKSAHERAAESVAFNVQPRRTGQLLIGSSRQYGNEDHRIDTSILQQMLDRAISYMPGIAQLSAVRTWTGFRAATEDKLPLIGRALGISEDSSLWLAVGFEGLGITEAPGAARLLVDAILDRASAIDRSPYLPSRLLAATEPVPA